MQANNKKTELALKQASTEVSAFVEDVEQEVQKIEAKFLSVVPDASNKEGYEFCKSVRAEVLPIKTGVEDARKTLKKPVIAMGKLIDSSLNPLSSRLEAVYSPFVEAYRAKDNEKKLREEARQASISEAFEKMNNVALEAMGQSSTVIETMIEELADFDFDPDVFMERTEEAVKRHSEIMGKLTDMLIAQAGVEEREAKAEEDRKRMAEIEAREAAIKAKEEAEARRIQQEADDKARAIREEGIRKQAQADAEAQHKADMEAAEQRRIEEAKQAEERAKQQAEAAAQAERDRAERQRQQEEAEAKARADDAAHRATINNEILTAILTTGITQDQAKAIICMAVKGQAGNMRVTY